MKSINKRTEETGETIKDLEVSSFEISQNKDKKLKGMLMVWDFLYTITCIILNG